MTAKDIFQIFILYNPDVRGVTGFKEMKNNKNAIELIFDNGRKGTFEVQRGKLKLTMEDNLYSIKKTEDKPCN